MPICFILFGIIMFFSCQSCTKSTQLSSGTTEFEQVNCKNDSINPFKENLADAEIAISNEYIDIAALIADPTPEEIRLALNDINRRDRSVKRLIEEDAFTVFMGTHKATARIVSHEVDGNRHYGSIITPETNQRDPLPILVYLEGFSQQVPSIWINQNNLFLTHLDKDYWHKFIIVIPSFRGQSLYFNDSTNNSTSYKSKGQRNDAFDGPAEDALGLLNIALETVENVDKDRIIVMGGSRGGTVALLMAERDSRIKWVLNFVGPLDFIGRTLFQRTFDIKLLENGIESNYQVPNNLGEQYVYFFLERLKKGEVSLEKVRKKIIQSSPYYFVSNLTKTQIQMHYGEDDISFVQLQRFNFQLEELGLNCPQYEVYTYAKRGHDLVGDKPVEDRVNEFANRVLQRNP